MSRLLGTKDTKPRIRATKETMQLRESLIRNIDVVNNKIVWNPDNTFVLIPKGKRGRKPSLNRVVVSKSYLPKQEKNEFDDGVLPENTLVKFRIGYKNPYQGTMKVITCDNACMEVVSEEGKQFPIGSWKEKVVVV